MGQKVALYPKLAQFYLYAEVAEYYRLFYHYQFGAEEFATLTARRPG